MKKKLLSMLAILLVLTLVFAGCSKEDDTSSKDEVKETNEELEKEKDEAKSVIDKGEKEVKEDVVVEGLTYQQAPMLDDMDLPPVEERLPDNPKIVVVQDEIGKYGGTIDKATTGVFNYLFETNNGESLIALNYPTTAGPLESNIAESWSWNEDGTVITFVLRKGIKWSDGVPLTTEDVEFTFNDIWLTPESLQTMPGSFMLNNEAPELEIVDDYTFSLTYASPYYYAETAIASTTTASILWPKHYVEQYHPKYNNDVSWEDFNENMAELSNGRASVTLYPWMLEEFIVGEKIVLKRNPYYWKVDEEGNQLPYADEVIFHIVEDRDTLALKAVAGEFDTDGMWLNAAHLQLLFSEKKARGYEIGWWQGVTGLATYFNMEVEDKQLQEIFRDVNFRRAASLLVDREDINQTVYSGLLNVTGTSFHTNTPYYTEKAAKSWSQYDVEKAKQLLANAGYSDSDGNGILEAKNGRELQFIVDVAADHAMYNSALAIMVDSFKEAGIELVINGESHDMMTERIDAGTWEMRIWDGDGMENPLLNTNTLVSWDDTATGAYWNKNNAENPLDGYQEFQKAILNATQKPYEERVANLQSANETLADQCWFLYVGSYVRPYYIGPNVGNHPLEATRQDVSSPFMLYQVFIADEE